MPNDSVPTAAELKLALEYELDGDLGEICHWIASPVRISSSFDEFHEVTGRAEKMMRLAYELGKKEHKL